MLHWQRERRAKEHCKDVDSFGDNRFTRARRKESMEEYHPSADWEGVKLPLSESQWKIRGIKEAVQIHRTGPHAMNQDGGHHQLPDDYTSLLTAAPPSGARQQ